MNKKGLVLGFIITALFLGGCGEDSSPTPFDESIQRVDPKYDSDAVVDGKFLDDVEASGVASPRFTDKERIQYGKAICTLLDNSTENDAKDIAKNYNGEQQAVSDAAIKNYCPDHLK